ncbi:bifunctional biotin--[acetyl-CoA-carboxylase] ligase/biotin operon repressor BirA [Alteromonas flava]|uniref:bifunctional biotin--[acetyl-CoA-carboxylase] ligase/biotin operon repressor BirA n=1 Tax=Alteromonas flava TaxID=2048003 RepID=UPI000C29169D|nr:bifunctional biotin--[acetyl-CoA-carboxylase] ligase/biotin operon repressor BirA [Alteromonas flava]
MTRDAASTRTQILQRLADGKFHSGEGLAGEFGISRTAIANHIKALGELGLDIFSVKGKGYCLADPITLLSTAAINALLPESARLPLTVLPIIDSTNNYIKQHIEQLPNGQVVVAEAQTAGRGRRGKTWVSPFASSLYLSTCWRFQGGFQQVAGLSLFVGITIIQALQALNIDGLAIKWPNDIYRHGEKLGGILVEIEGQIDTQVNCIIGIGINVNLPDVTAQIDQPFTDLSDLALDRNQLCAAIIQALSTGLPEFASHGLDPIVGIWNEWDIFYQQPVSIHSQGRVVEGINQGIDAQGALLLETPKGQQIIHAGEVSLRGR